MTHKDLERLFLIRPFEPFRLHMSDGSNYLVPHQDFGEITKSQLILTVPSQGTPNQIIECSILHITRIERPPIPEQPAKENLEAEK